MALRIGIDAGSKTIKVVVLNEDGTLAHSVYRRHRFDIKTMLGEVLHDLAWRYGDLAGTVGVTGSAGIGLAEALRLPFVQEVVATTQAVRQEFPQADAIIELGGEDAKVVYLTGTPEQRMNATCAGGTGGFIDTIAFMLGTTSSQMSSLALGANRIYPIASRCAVFAQTDVRPLLNAGARTADIAASALEAVVRQTLGGLACGRPIAGTVVFLGGPLEHIPDLVRRFRAALGLTHATGIKPQDAHLFTAKGAALYGAACPQAEALSLSELQRRLAQAAPLKDDLPRLPPLFASEAEQAAFGRRHAQAAYPRARLFDCEGPLYVGFDAGSTAVKLAVLNQDAQLVHTGYRPTAGDALRAASELLAELYQALPRAYDGTPYCTVAHATATGYGEDLLCAALNIDSGVVETTAHTRAALQLQPGLTFLLDIGGQDMKAIWVRDGVVEEAVLNEACSSGCGSFVEGTAHSLRCTPQRFAEAALAAQAPIDLGTKCTVFMTSRVRHAQKAGAELGDLAAGIAYSVVKNALFRIIGMDNVEGMGANVVVQGGAFKSDAVLRAFELVSGVEAVRPDTAHLMGAIGAALVARERAARQAGAACGMGGLPGSAAAGDMDGFPSSGAAGPARHSAAGHAHSTLIGAAELAELAPQRMAARCPGCTNACALSVVAFQDGRRFVSGNRCERAAALLGGERARAHAKPPNTAALEQRLLARYRSLGQGGPRGQVGVGIMTSLMAYAQLPFWHTLLARLGFTVLVPAEDPAAPNARSHAGVETIPSESVCYPAKLSHTRLYALVQAGATAVLMPRYLRGRRCPVSCGYASALHDAAPVFGEAGIAFAAPVLHAMRPCAMAGRPDDRAELLAGLRRLAPAAAPIGEAEFGEALEAALAEHGAFQETLARGTQQALAWAHEPGHHGIVIAGRPYHTDPAVLHSVDRVLQGLGFAVIAETGLDVPKHGEGEGEAAETGSGAAGNPAAPPTDAPGIAGGNSPRAHAATPIPAPLAAADPAAPSGSAPSWKQAKHLVRLARYVAADPALDLVCLQSFGCGYDAVSLPEARNVLKAAGKAFTALKVDDIADTAHIRIRLRTLAEGIEHARATQGSARGTQERGASRKAAGRSEATGRSKAKTGALPAPAAGRASALEGPAAAGIGEGAAAPPRHGGLPGTAPLPDGVLAAARAGDARAFTGLGQADLDAARPHCRDVCLVASALIGRAVRIAAADPAIGHLAVPEACESCVLDALPSVVGRACERAPHVTWERTWPKGLMENAGMQPAGGSGEPHAQPPGRQAPQPAASPAAPDVPGAAGTRPAHAPERRPLIGIVGAAPLVFEPGLNDNLLQLIASLGCDALLPDPQRMLADDVRYLDQLDAFAEAGVGHVLYLLSFGCLKGHVQARGALRGLARRYPGMPVTVIDYDPEASALNRENRIRLALSTAQEQERP